MTVSRHNMDIHMALEWQELKTLSAVTLHETSERPVALCGCNQTNVESGLQTLRTEMNT